MQAELYKSIASAANCQLTFVQGDWQDIQAGSKDGFRTALIKDNFYGDTVEALRINPVLTNRLVTLIIRMKAIEH